MINFLNKVDQDLFLLLNGMHAEFLNPLMVLLSGQSLWIPLILFFLWKGKKSMPKKPFWLFFLFMILAVVASDVTSSYILKNLVTRMRPCRLEEFRGIIYQFGQKCGGRFGFVSSHAANSVAVLVFSFRCLRLRGWHHLMWLLPILVSFSRIYLGVHYPGDVLGGILVGVLWGFIFSEGFRRT